MRFAIITCVCLIPTVGFAQAPESLRRSLTFHAAFDQSFAANFSRGDPQCVSKRGNRLLPLTPGDEVALVTDAGRFGGALHFPRKGTTRPQFSGVHVLGYNDTNWNATVSVWLRLSPDEDLEPGYCDPVQIVGDDNKKGFIFLEWSKDESPRLFRYAIRPLFHIWNPSNVQWADIPFEKRPMVQVAKAPFNRQHWTHVAFTVAHLNDKNHKPSGSLYIDGKLQGRIENWDLTFDWDPAQVALVLGASYVGYLDDLAVFDRVLSDLEIEQLFRLEQGVSSLH